MQINLYYNQEIGFQYYNYDNLNYGNQNFTANYNPQNYYHFQPLQPFQNVQTIQKIQPLGKKNGLTNI